jgi:hypothetical protein
MKRNSNLALATMACLSQRALDAAADAGCLSKSDLRTIAGLRASGGRCSGDIAKSRLMGSVRKQFAERDVLRKAIEAHARDAASKETEMTEDRVVADRVEKARTEQRLYADLIKAYAAEHPGATKADCIDAVLLGPVGKRMVELDRAIDALAKAKNTLAQPGPTTNIDFGTPGVRGGTGYDASVADTHPRNQAAGENPIIRDHHETLNAIKSGKLLWNDPKVQALVALERKRIFEND